MIEQIPKKHEKRLAEIEDRIQGLKEHRIMWLRAGYCGYNRYLQANHEISELLAEKERILDGRQDKIDKISQEISELQSLKEQCHAIRFIKRGQIQKEINTKKEEKQRILRRR